MPGGPPKLRSRTEVYGLKGLKAKEDEAVLIGEQGGVVIIEQPMLREGEPHMFHFNSFQRLRALPKVTINNGAQCAFGAQAQKLTSWLNAGVDLRDLPTKCTHVARFHSTVQ